jgi:hypothetical protein
MMEKTSGKMRDIFKVKQLLIIQQLYVLINVENLLLKVAESVIVVNRIGYKNRF